MDKRKLTIAVDFDGTIVEHQYPEIGVEMPLAFEVLRELQSRGHRLILWTYRDGVDLKNAVDYCLDKGIFFYAVNESHPDEEFNKYMSRKIDADIFIDDRIVGGFPGWHNIRKIIIPDSEFLDEDERSQDTTGSSFFGLFKKSKK
jgi:hypothetical protein